MNNLKNISNSKLRRILSIGRDVSLIIMENPSTHLYSEDKNLYLSFLDDYFIFRYTNLSQCIKYFKKASRQEYVILLFYGFDKDNIETMISQLDQCEQLKTIFILYSSNNDDVQYKMHNNNGSKCSSGTSTKLIKSFYEWESLSTSLQQHIIEAKNGLKDAGLFNMCSSPENALRDLRRELGSFVWTQTFRG